MKLSLVLAILSKLPVDEDDAADVQTLCQQLEGRVSTRTMQRCMEYLSAGDVEQGLPALARRIEPPPAKQTGRTKSVDAPVGRAYRYCLESSALKNWFMTDQMALNLTLANQAVGSSLGGSQRIGAKKLAAQAGDFMRQKTLESRRLWRHVRVVPDGMGRMPATIATAVIESVLEAIARDRELEFTYSSRSGKGREWRLGPRGLVAKDGTLYLIATQGLSPQPVTFALHRMEQAAVSSQPTAPMDFDLDRFLEQTQQLSHPLGDGEPVLLKLRVAQDTLYHFEERPLWGQEVEPDTLPGHSIVTARVPVSVVLVPFLLSMSPGVEVLEPPKVRQQLADRIAASARLYLRRSGKLGV